MIISRHRFAENGKEMYRNKKKKNVKGVQSSCFCQLNVQNLWHRRCRRVVDVKIPILGSATLGQIGFERFTQLKAAV